MGKGSLRIGCVPYVNAYPLWRRLKRELIFAPPAELYRMMEAGDCDVALLPSIALSRHPNWQIVSKTCIASHGPVMSVKLFYRRPIRECRRIVLDPESMSSNAMLELLLRQHLGGTLSSGHFELPVVRERTPSDGVDAFLLIGDEALAAHYDGWEELDLGEAWRKWTGLPFVYAVWLGLSADSDRYAGLACELEQGLTRSLAELDAWFPEIAQRFASLRLAKIYFTQALDYELSTAHRAGLLHFLDKALTLLCGGKRIEAAHDVARVEGV